MSTLGARALRWRHNGHSGVSNHRPHNCLLNRLVRRRSKKTSKLRVTGLCARNSPVTGEFPAQMASNAENVSIWLRHHGQLFRAWSINYIPQYLWDVSTYPSLDTCFWHQSPHVAHKYSNTYLSHGSYNISPEHSTAMQYYMTTAAHRKTSLIHTRTKSFPLV